MVKKIFSLLIIISFLVSFDAYANELGGLLGFECQNQDGNLWGLAWSLYAVINISENFSWGPILNFWSSKYYLGETINEFTEFTPAYALKFTLPFGSIKPFLGFEPELHMRFENGGASNSFGFSGFIGFKIVLSKYLMVPIQANYGLIFSGGVVGAFTTKIGIEANL